jgi:hypothetical protein
MQTNELYAWPFWETLFFFATLLFRFSLSPSLFPSFPLGFAALAATSSQKTCFWTARKT